MKLVSLKKCIQAGEVVMLVRTDPIDPTETQESDDKMPHCQDKIQRFRPTAAFFTDKTTFRLPRSSTTHLYRGLNI